MSDAGSVTNWIADLKRGEQHAAQPLWERYIGRLVELARVRVRSSRRRSADEEDVAVTAFEHFWQGLRDDRFPRLNDRNDLWQILVMLTDRRATDFQRRSQFRSKHEVGESALAVDAAPRPIAQIAGAEPDPEFALQFVDNLDRLLERLEDDTLRQIALWKLEGLTHAEIAEQVGCVERTIERKVRMIRDRLSED